jgi:hypothetical protein
VRLLKKAPPAPPPTLGERVRRAPQATLALLVAGAAGVATFARLRKERS